MSTPQEKVKTKQKLVKKKSKMNVSKKTSKKSKKTSKKSKTTKTSGKPESAPKQKIAAKDGKKKLNPQPVTPEQKLLSTVELDPAHTLTFKYFGKLKTEHKEELKVYNATDVIVAFKVKTTAQNLIKVSPVMGYLKPKGKLTFWVIVNPTRDGKPLKRERVTVLLSLTKRDNLPANPENFWKGANKPQDPFRRSLKIAFELQGAPPPQSVFAPGTRWVDKVKKVAGDDESDSECGSTSSSSATP